MASSPSGWVLHTLKRSEGEGSESRSTKYFREKISNVREMTKRETLWMLLEEEEREEEGEGKNSRKEAENKF